MRYLDIVAKILARRDVYRRFLCITRNENVSGRWYSFVINRDDGVFFILLSVRISFRLYLEYKWMFVEITYLDTVCFSLSNFSNVYFAQNKIRVIILISQISINVHRPIISPLFLYIYIVERVIRCWYFIPISYFTNYYFSLTIQIASVVSLSRKILIMI